MADMQLDFSGGLSNFVGEIDYIRIYSGVIFCGDAYHQYPVGDVNKDCKVNFFDIAIVAEHWLECTGLECD
jgi:hypothetical protein